MTNIDIASPSAGALAAAEPTTETEHAPITAPEQSLPPLATAGREGDESELLAENDVAKAQKALPKEVVEVQEDFSAELASESVTIDNVNPETNKPCSWTVSPVEDGVVCKNSVSGEVYHGSIKGFSEILRS